MAKKKREWEGYSNPDYDWTKDEYLWSEDDAEDAPDRELTVEEIEAIFINRKPRLKD